MRARREAEEQQKRWQYRIQRGRVWFDEEVRRAQRASRQSIPAFIWDSSVASLLTTPLVYSLLLPFVVLDVWVTLYQWVCFPIYGIARVPRGRYFVIDRHKLAYLNGIEKVTCVYCEYANGVIAYVREVAARTEQYWCPIKHARAIPTPHARYPPVLRLRRREDVSPRAAEAATCASALAEAEVTNSGILR